MASSPPSPSRRRVVGMSTKMYFSAARTRAYVAAVLEDLSRDPSLKARADVFVIPDFVTLSSVVAQTAGSGCLVGAQDCGAADYGAFTGTVSPAVLAEAGARLVEVGHAERRRLCGETDATTAAKARAAAEQGLVPLICVGEASLGDGGEAAAAAAAAATARQLDAILASVPPAADVLVAYEPLWAIGAAQPAPPDHVIRVARCLRVAASVRARPGRTRILYGGSAGPGLFASLAGAVDGLFLGRFAHDPERFCQTVREVAEPGLVLEDGLRVAGDAGTSG